MPYIVKCWIPVDEEKPEVYDNLVDAEQDVNQAEMMQPENKYSIVECDKHGEEL